MLSSCRFFFRKFFNILNDLVIVRFFFALFLILFLDGFSDGQKNGITEPPSTGFCQIFQAEQTGDPRFASDNASNFPFIKDDKTIESLDLSDGEINWLFDSGANAAKRNLVSGGFVYTANLIKGNQKTEETEKNEDLKIIKKEGFGIDLKTDSLIIRSISGYTGLTVWKKEFEFADDLHGVLSAEQTHIYNLENSLFVRSSFCFLRINKLDGNLIWKKCIKSAYSVANETFNQRNNERNYVLDAFFGNLYGITDRSYFYLTDLENGELISRTYLEFDITAVELVNRLTIIYGDTKGVVRAKNTGNNKILWTVKTGGQISGIIKNRYGLLVSSFDNFAYLLDANSGRKIWKRRFAGKLRERPSANEILAVITGDESETFIVNLSEGKILDKISLPAGEYFLRLHGFIGGYFYLITDKRMLVYQNGNCL